MKNDFLIKLIGLSQLVEQHKTLEEGLRDLTRLSADLLKAERCSIMLIASEDGGGDRRLRVSSHQGYLPAAALRESMPLDQGIAGHVVRTGKPQLVQNIADSEFSSLARSKGYSSPSLICAPIRVSGDVIGAINISDPHQGRIPTQDDLELVEVFAMFIGQSIHTFQLQKLVESRVLQMAMLQERRERSSAWGKPISPDPSRLAKIVAKNFFRELTNAGFGPNAVISVASEVLSMLNTNLAKHKTRREREAVHDADTLES